ncbi:MAG: DUF445 domain-containing protein [Gemmatimonadota bacterium]
MTAPIPNPPPKSDEVRRAELTRMRRIATGMLLGAAVVFIGARLLEPSFPWLVFVRVTAEAAMVGGLADWFAVTALFRHPLGMPIPHTAIVPSRKDRVGRSIGHFVQKNFLNPDNIARRLRAARVTEYLADWISQPENARTVSRHIGSALAAGARTLRDEDVEELIHSTVVRKAEATPVAPLLGKLLGLLTADNRHQELFDQAIKLMARGVAENRQLIRDRIQEESPWWLPDPVEQKIYEKIVGAIDRTLADIRDNPEHPLRDRFDEALAGFIDELHHSPAVIQKAETLKHELLDADAMRRFSGSLWVDVRDGLIRRAEQPERLTPDAIERALSRLGETVRADPELLEKIDNWIVQVAALVVDRFRDEVAQLIEDTVRGWDAEATSNRIELAVGRDLQFIRINGTVVGGLAGLVIYCVSLLF